MYFDINYNVFHFITIFFKNKSDMCDTKAVLVSLSLFLMRAASFCIYRAHTENKVGHHSKVKSQCSCENEYKKYCLNVGEGFYLIDEDIVGCNCTWLYGGMRCEKYICWD